MSTALSETTIVKAVATQAIQRLTRKAVADLQRMKHTLSGDDSELKTTWDEICAQVQYEHFFAWEVYDQTVRAVVEGLVADLPQHEKQAIWLQTDAGFDWDCEEPASRRSNPVTEDDIVEYVTSEHDYAEAGKWSNARVRAFIERSSMRD